MPSRKKRLRKTPLACEANKYDTFEAFEDDYRKGAWGRYWHLTEDSGFSIKQIGSRDMSSMAMGETTEPGLMVSANPDSWRPYFQERKFIVELDLSCAIPNKDYWFVNRGFAQEMMIRNLKGVKVKRVLPLKKGLAQYYSHVRRLPRSSEELENIWNHRSNCCVRK